MTIKSLKTRYDNQAQTLSRSIMKKLTVSIVLLMALPAMFTCIAKEKVSSKNTNRQAILLVLQTQETLIEELDEDLSADTKKRSFIAYRPRGSSFNDSSYLFVVTLYVDGKDYLSWDVDTRESTVKKINKVQTGAPRKSQE
jgi:hypothetical protein